MSRIIKLNIGGMHCKACKALIEEEVGALEGVEKIEVDLVKETGTLKIKDEDNLKEVFKTIKKIGYSAEQANEEKALEKKSLKKNYIIAVIFLTLFMLGYFLLQSLGGFQILSALNEKNISYSLIFLIGVLASFHCIGMCGGFVVSYTIADGEQKLGQKKYNKHFLYNLGRLISYTIIGGILGGFGSVFGINPSFSGTLLFLAGIIMILMGLSILTNFKVLRNMTKFFGSFEFVAKYLYRNKKSTKPKGPLMIGLLTGLMPCGPLQAMQLYALTTGSIIEGAFSMFLYSLGTIPLMFGFGTIVGMFSGSKIKQIIKISGAVVILLGFVMINRGLTNFGLGFTKLLASPVQNIADNTSEESDEKIQIVEMDVTYSGYKPNVIYIKKDIPVRWIIKDKGITGCTNEIFLYHEKGIIKKRLNQNENVIEFTPTVLGELKFSCWMRMVWGKFVVVDN